MNALRAYVLAVHVAAGGLALVLGAVPLVAKKGGALHRRSGLLFVLAMLVMAISAAVLGNVLGGVITVYFVLTALTTVRRASPWIRGFNAAALAVAFGLSLLCVMGGVKAFNSPGGVLNGAPFQMHFFLAAVIGLAAAGDVRLLRSGGLRGGPRLARHLWRMCFALFIAAGSFFSIRERVAKILPEPFTRAPMRTLPIVALFGAMFYWLWRVRRRRALPVLVRDDSMPIPTGAK
jgi:uncharacterized membrane protein